MLDQDMQDAINTQIRNEYYSSYLYLSMSAYCESRNFPGFASWLRRQSEEELVHAMKLLDYMLDRGGRVVLESIDRPPSEFGTLLEVFEELFEHEREVTGMINSLYDLALSQNDHATAVALHWFIEEQVEEEKSAEEVVEKLKLAADNGAALMILDAELGSRQGE